MSTTSSSNFSTSTSTTAFSRPCSVSTHLPVWPNMAEQQQRKPMPQRLHHPLSHSSSLNAGENAAINQQHPVDGYYAAGEGTAGRNAIGSQQQQQCRSSWTNLLAADMGGVEGAEMTTASANRMPPAGTMFKWPWKSGTTNSSSKSRTVPQPTAFLPPPPYDHFQQMPAPYPACAISASSSSPSSSSTFLPQSGAVVAAANAPFLCNSKPAYSHFQFSEPGAPHHPLCAQQPPRPGSSTFSGSPAGQSAERQSAAGSARGTAPGGGAGSGLSRRSEPSSTRDKKRDRMQELRDLWARPGCKLCCLALILLLIALLIAAAFVTSSLALPQHLEFAWFAPEQFRKVAGVGSAGQQQAATPNRGRMDVGKMGQQVRLELQGADPFRSNFLSVLDFQTNKVAILDLSLRSGQQNLVCFVMDLDRQNIPEMESLLRAAKAGAERHNQLHGWDESWFWVPTPLSQSPVFHPEVAECRGARWVQLTRTGNNQRDQKCTECFDFCLPDWGIDRDAIRDEQFLNVLRRICFSLFVPEWRPFAQSLSMQQNQHDFEQFYRLQQQQQLLGAASGIAAQGTQLGMAAGGGQQQPEAGSETKWVWLQQTPQQQKTAISTGGIGGGGILPPSASLSASAGNNVAPFPGQWQPQPPQQASFPNQQPAGIQSPSWPQSPPSADNWPTSNVGQQIVAPQQQQRPPQTPPIISPSNPLIDSAWNGQNNNRPALGAENQWPSQKQQPPQGQQSQQQQPFFQSASTVVPGQIGIAIPSDWRGAGTGPGVVLGPQQQQLQPQQVQQIGRETLSAPGIPGRR